MSELTRHERLYELVRSTIALPETIWRDHLEDLCPNDSELVEEALTELSTSARLGNEGWQGASKVSAALQATHTALARNSTALGTAPQDLLLAILERPFDLERYELLEELGRGHVGAVHRVRDTLLSRELAMKIANIGPLDQDLEHAPARALRFIREAQVTAQLDHQAVVSIYDIAARRSDGQAYFTMDLVRGMTVASAAAQDSPTEQRALLEPLIAVGHALSDAHSQGLVHGDISSSNVMLTPNRAGFLMDWEMASSTQPTKSFPDATPIEAFTGARGQGTTWFLSPQRARDLEEGLKNQTTSTLWALCSTTRWLVRSRLAHRCRLTHRALRSSATLLGRQATATPKKPRPPSARRNLRQGNGRSHRAPIRQH